MAAPPPPPQGLQEATELPKNALLHFRDHGDSECDAAADVRDVHCNLGWSIGRLHKELTNHVQCNCDDEDEDESVAPCLRVFPQLWYQGKLVWDNASSHGPIDRETKLSDLGIADHHSLEFTSKWISEPVP
mmetsp:Transcript_46734/g.99842  ORF Transcript_46734/g.99842 Transcript_46734/m.99842 type:complete len:131 (+) Transcript_46734:69-461(+)